MFVPFPNIFGQIFDSTLSGRTHVHIYMTCKCAKKMGIVRNDPRIVNRNVFVNVTGYLMDKSSTNVFLTIMPFGRAFMRDVEL